MAFFLSPSKIAAALLSVSIACSGDGTAGPDDKIPATPEECLAAAPVTEASVVRLLNKREYQNTVQDLLNITTTVIDQFPDDPLNGFDNNAGSLVASAPLISKQLEAAESLAKAVTLTSILPCTASSQTCPDEFIQTFGRKAFRRPMKSDEMAAMKKVYSSARTAGRTFDEAIRLVLQAFLQAPQFLYRLESSLSATGGTTTVGPYEMASRLSYFFWASMPDAQLLTAAEQGKLTASQDIEAQAKRLLADMRAKDMVASFHRLWLQLYQLDVTKKVEDQFPTFTTLKPLFAKETEQFVDYTFWNGDGIASNLLMSNVGFVNAALAQHYDMKGVTGTQMRQVDTTGTNRFGLLTQGSILSQLSNPDRNSPTRRGKFVRLQLLCQPPPPPPGNTPPISEEPVEGKTFRQRLAQHASNPACAGCHSLIDPVGFGLENYDTVGKYRTEDNGEAIDASGNLISVSQAGSFTGAKELSDRLRQSDEYTNCVATQWFRFAMGRVEGARDYCSIHQLQQQFKQSGGRMRDLLVNIAMSDAFLRINQEKGQ